MEIWSVKKEVTVPSDRRLNRLEVIAQIEASEGQGAEKESLQQANAAIDLNCRACAFAVQFRLKAGRIIERIKVTSKIIRT